MRRLARDLLELLQYLRIPVAAVAVRIYVARAVPAPLVAAAVPVLGPAVPELVPPAEPVAAAAAAAAAVAVVHN